MEHNERAEEVGPQRRGLKPAAEPPSADVTGERSLSPRSTADTVIRLQRLAGNRAVAEALAAAPAPAIPPAGPGEPLDGTTRLDMEAHLGADFGQVRVHQDADADDAARSVGASAFTVGSDIVFGRDRYAPHDTGGRQLLAHELTHVRQQQQGPVSGTDRGDGVMVSEPSDRYEQEARLTSEVIPAHPLGRTEGAARSPALPPAPGAGALGAPVLQTVPTVTAVVAPAAVGVGKTAAVTATAAGAGKLVWTLVGAPAGVAIAPVGARSARITAKSSSLAGAGTVFTVKAALAATPGDNKLSGAVVLAGVTALAFTPVPAFPAIPAPMAATGPVSTGEPNRDGVTGNTVTVAATTAPAGRPVTLQLPVPKDSGVAGTTITPGTVTGKMAVRAKDDGTGAVLDKFFFINPVPKKVSSLGPQTPAPFPYGALNLVKFSASDAASPLTRGVGETITAGGVDDLGLVPVVNGGPNPNPKLPSTVSASFWNDQNTTPAANATVKALVDVNKFVGPGVAKALPAVTKFRQGFHWLAWTGVPNYSSEIDVGFHRRSLVQAGAGFKFVTEQVFPAGSAPVKKDAYAGNPLIKFTALTVIPKVPAAAGGFAADGKATADVKMAPLVAGRVLNWFLVSGPIAFSGASAAVPIATAVNLKGGTVAGPSKLRGEDTKFPNRQFTGVVPLRAVVVSPLAGGLAKVPAGTLSTTFTFNAAPGGRTINPTVDGVAAAAGVTAAVASPAGAVAAARTVTVTRPAVFIGSATVTVTDSVLAAKLARRTVKFL